MSRRWNNFAVQRLINEYENFNFEKDFPATAKYVYVLSQRMLMFIARWLLISVQSCRWHAALNAVPAVKKNVDERTALLAKA